MYKLLSGIWLFLFCCHISHARAAADSGAENDSLSTVQVVDSSDVTSRSFEEASLDRFREHPDFQYSEQQLDLTWWQRLKQWVRYKIAELMSREGSWSLLKNTILVLGVAVLIYLIMKLLGMDATSIFLRKPQAVVSEPSGRMENLHAIDFDHELQDAITSGNYRLAVRMLYLACLRKLSDRQMVEWLPAKTNTAYVDELRGTPLEASFRQLTRQFEYIWYGDFRIDRQRFMQLHEAFRQFDEELK